MGVVQMEKNQDIILAQELFTAWDIHRRGYIEMNVMAENLISFGLAMSKNEVIKLMIQLIEGQKGHTSN